MMRKVILLEDYNKKHPEHINHKYIIPRDSTFFYDVCYEDGSPIIVCKNKPCVVKAGKRKYLKVVYE